MQENKRIEKGVILEARYDYGWETTLYDFWEVLSVSPKGMATIRQLEKEHKYFPGADGCIYYDTPEEVTPSKSPVMKDNYHDLPNGSYVKVREEVVVRRKIYNFGTDREYIIPEPYFKAKVWDGNPKAVHNWH